MNKTLKIVLIAIAVIVVLGIVGRAVVGYVAVKFVKDVSGEVLDQTNKVIENSGDIIENVNEAIKDSNEIINTEENTNSTTNIKEEHKETIQTTTNEIINKVEEITENKTTKPPIIKIVFMELEILSPMIPPKLDREIVSLELLYLLGVDKLFSWSHFQNLKIMPTLIEARR